MHAPRRVFRSVPSVLGALADRVVRPAVLAAIAGGLTVPSDGLLEAQTVAPFTSEHSPRGVIYNMLFAPPITAPQDGFPMAVADLDGDGDADLVLTGRIDGQIGVFENTGAGVFVNRSAASGLANMTSVQGMSAFDADRDGDLDLFLANRHGACRLYRNDGGLAFTDVTAAAGVGVTVPATGTSVVDFDGDGDLDLHLSSYSAVARNILFRNNGDWTFTDVAPALGLDSAGLSYQSVWSDVDLDGDSDLVVSNDRGFGNVPNQLWRNDGGTFTDISAASGMDVSLCSMGVACGDLDGDGRPDFYFTNLPDPAPPLFGANPLLLNAPGPVFTEAQEAWGVASFRMSWGAVFWDFDNDGDLDLYVNNETQPNALYRNAGAPPMTDIAALVGVTGTGNLSYCSVVGDLDRDGDLDLLLNNYGSATRLLMNQEGQRRAWLRMRVAGEGRLRDAAGASARVMSRAPKAKSGKSPALVQWREVLVGGNGFVGQHESTLHFGLGAASAVESIEVRWPAGEGGATRVLTGYGAGVEWTAYPPSRLGDVEGDGVVGLADWTAFAVAGFGAVSPGREMFDFDGDGDRDAGDLAAFWSRASIARGDLDGDGVVNAGDLAILLGAWGTGGVPADLDLDGTVNAGDL
ncbi:MAG: hypothetical protein RI967_1788, partial [Planctomycetota bacterium]